jgi:lipoprotein-anchoring transpeptidase ErfK/SrfK
MKSISRRDFLKLGGLALGGLAFSSYLPEFTEFEDIDLVRVADDSVSVYSQPDDTSRIVRTWMRDDLIHVYETVRAETPGYNPFWYRVFGGYMHRARLQKVWMHYNVPLTYVPETKLLAEATVPYAQAYKYNQWEGWKPTFRYYYGTIHWVVGLEQGPDGQPWYRIQDELDESIHMAPAVQFRPIPAEEIAPISPEVPLGKKRIEVDLRTQILTCYEYDQSVFTTDISSGLEGLWLDRSSTTPAGQHNVLVKMPSKHMGGGSLFSASSEPLPGVPWTSFFTTEGHAFHGTYWHENFGVPMSHGCVNMRTEEAKWLFRWCQPPAPFEEINKLTLDMKGYGTFVDIHY